MAVSPVGAFGLCQFMPATSREMIGRHESLTDLWLPEQSIMAAGLYMHRLIKSWSAPRPSMDRYMLALASYNAGMGNILKSQRLSGGKNSYQDIINYLPEVTGRHSEETKNYVVLIVSHWWPMMLFE
jgi:membrane-bound lytic murein transglycosylase F